MNDYFVMVDYVINCGVIVPVSAGTPEEAEKLAVQQVEDALFYSDSGLAGGGDLVSHNQIKRVSPRNNSHPD